MLGKVLKASTNKLTPITIPMATVNYIHFTLLATDTELNVVGK